MTCSVDDNSNKIQTLFYCTNNVVNGTSFGVSYCLKNSTGSLTICGGTGQTVSCPNTNMQKCPYSIFYSKAISNIHFSLLAIISFYIAYAF